MIHKVEVHKTRDECIKIIKMNFPNHYELINIDMGDRFGLNRYTFKERNNRIFFYINRMAVPPTKITCDFIEYKDGRTILNLKFKENLPIKLFIWANLVSLFLASLYMFVNMLLENEILSNIPGLFMAIVLFTISPLFMSYIIKFKIIDRENFIKIIERIDSIPVVKN